MKEYSWLASFPFAGASVATVLIYPLGGVLGSTVGWRSIFYTTGGLSMAVTVLWFLLVFDRPEDHPRISKVERDYILESQRESGGRSEVEDTPWSCILRSLPVWAVVISHWSSNWGSYLLQMLLPTYLSDILGLDLLSNGLFTALPYLAQVLVSIMIERRKSFSVRSLLRTYYRWELWADTPPTGSSRVATFAP